MTTILICLSDHRAIFSTECGGDYYITVAGYYKEMDIYLPKQDGVRLQRAEWEYLLYYVAAIDAAAEYSKCCLGSHAYVVKKEVGKMEIGEIFEAREQAADGEGSTCYSIDKKIVLQLAEWRVLYNMITGFDSCYSRLEEVWDLNDNDNNISDS